MTSPIFAQWVQAAQGAQSLHQVAIIQQRVRAIAECNGNSGLLELAQSRAAVFARLDVLASSSDKTAIIEARLGQLLAADIASFEASLESDLTSATVTPWFRSLEKPDWSRQPGLIHFVRKSLSALIWNPNQGLDPLVAQGHTHVESPPNPVRSIEQGARLLVSQGWNERVAALRGWADSQLEGLPQSQQALNQVLRDIQWFRERLGRQLENILRAVTPHGETQEALGERIQAYHESRSEWLSIHNREIPIPMTPLEVEFELDRDIWKKAHQGDTTILSTNEDLIAHGLSPLALRMLGIYDKRWKRSPVQALPQSTLVFILQNPGLQCAEAEVLLRAAGRYYSAHRVGGNPAKIRAYAEAMQAFLSDPIRAQLFLVELSFVDTARKLILEDPDFIVEEILEAHADVIFDDTPPDSLQGRKLMGFLLEAREKVREAEVGGNRLKIEKARQAHNNVLAIFMFHFGPRLIPYLVDHPRYSDLNNLEQVEHRRQALYRERARMSWAQRVKWEGASKQIDTFWNEEHDPGLAQLQAKVFEYLLGLFAELMQKVQATSFPTHQKLEGAYVEALNRAKDAIQKFHEWDQLRKDHLERIRTRRPETQDTDKRFNARAHNRAIEKVLQSLLGTSSEIPIFQRLFDIKKWVKGVAKTPGILEVVRQAMKAAHLPEADLQPVVPLFSAFASNYRPLTWRERWRVAVQNPISFLMGYVGGPLSGLLSTDHRSQGTNFSDMHLMSWATAVGEKFHDHTIVADPMTVGALFLHWPAPVIDSKHTAWFSDFNQLLQIAGAVSPRRGDPIRMRAARILAKAGLEDLMPVFGIGLKKVTIPVSDKGYVAAELRGAQSMVFGDIFTDPNLGFLIKATDLKNFQQVPIAARPGPRSVGVFSEITMPVPDSINPFDPTLEGTLAIPPISVPLIPIGRGPYMALVTEAITGRPQMALWPTPNGSFATFPKPDARVRAYRGVVRTVVPLPIFNDALPGSHNFTAKSFARFLLAVGNQQRSVWWAHAMQPKNQTPAPQEAEFLKDFIRR